tara:strand:+ start:675 stop:884 length:210 start_codon:yes stop_codon:yes gene_type:complete
MWIQTLRMCVAGAVCFAGLTTILVHAEAADNPYIMVGVVVAGVGLAMLFRISIDVLAVKITQNNTNDPD